MSVKYLKEWENELNICIRCGYCFEGCPVFSEGGWEPDGARGKAVLAYGLLSGDLEPDAYIAGKIFECSMCRDCVERCSANVNIPGILTAARADLVEAGLAYRGHDELTEKIAKTGNLFGKSLEPVIRDGDTPVLVGCRFKERRGDTERYIAMLEKLGFKPKVVDEVCCGMPYGVLGRMEDLKRHKEIFKERFPFRDFLCLCTTCASFIKSNYPELNPRYVITEILEPLKKTPHKKLGIRGTYHDPCNLARGMRIIEEPREVLREIGVELVELPTNRLQAECCGGGGGMLVTDKKTVDQLSAKRLHQTKEIGVGLLTTLCPTCELDFKSAAESEKIGVEAVNVLDLVCEALDL